MNRIAVYFRVSTKKQDYEIQQRAFHEWLAEPNNGGRVYVYTDTKSGNAARRPGYDRMLSDVRKGHVDHVVVYAIDRLSRNKVAGLEVVLELIRREVKFTSITQPFLSTASAMPFQNVLLAAFTELAAIERETIVRRVKAGMENAKAKGKVLGKPTKLTRSMHVDILRLKAEGLGVRKLAEHFGVGHSLIERAVNHDLDNNIHYTI